MSGPTGSRLTPTPSHTPHASSRCALQDGTKHELGGPNPFAGEEGEELASAGYRYRKWELKKGMDIVVRCEVNAATTTPKGDVQLASIKALNKWNLKETDWRKKLDQSRASVSAHGAHAPPANPAVAGCCAQCTAGPFLLQLVAISGLSQPRMPAATPPPLDAADGSQEQQEQDGALDRGGHPQRRGGHQVGLRQPRRAARQHQPHRAQRAGAHQGARIGLRLSPRGRCGA